MFLDRPSRSADLARDWVPLVPHQLTFGSVPQVVVEILVHSFRDVERGAPPRSSLSFAATFGALPIDAMSLSPRTPVRMSNASPASMPMPCLSVHPQFAVSFQHSCIAGQMTW